MLHNNRADGTLLETSFEGWCFQGKTIKLEHYNTLDKPYIVYVIIINTNTCMHYILYHILYIV